MESDKLFNELNGSKVTRERIGEIIEIAKTENNTSVIYRLFKILNDNPYKTYFEIESLKEYPKSLNGVQHTGIYKVALDNCGRLMPGFKYENGLVVRTQTGDKYFKPKAQKKSKEVVKKPTETKEIPAKTVVLKDKKNTKVAEVKKETPVLAKDKKSSQAKTETAVIPGKEKVSESQSNKNVGFMLMDSISGGMVASKKTLPELKNAFDSLEDKETFSDMEVFVYEIVSKNGKNAQGKRVVVDWEKKAVDKKGQIALFGAKEKALKGAVETQEEISDLEIAEIVQIIKEEMPERKVIVFDNGMPQKICDVKSNPLIKSSSDLMSMHFDSLEFSDGWENFLQSPAKNMKIAVYGAPKNGKTSGFCDFANYLTKFGNILYNFADQGFNKSTQDIWKQAGLSENPKAFSTDTRSLDDLEKLVASGDYDFVLIDMISTYIDRTGIKPHEFDERFIKKYPDVSFLLLFEVTKSGNFKGDQGWTHIVDAIVVVENFLMESRGRYGTGHYVVWEEGLKKHNPKKYEEIFLQSEPTEESISTENVKLSFEYQEK